MRDVSARGRVLDYRSLDNRAFTRMVMVPVKSPSPRYRTLLGSDLRGLALAAGAEMFEGTNRILLGSFERMKT
ncbi:MAG TPA: hypothetical protein VFD47_12255 [Actinomycetota bacterium]|nr:hypothetical protein [Actinomycetota bacterium]